MTTKRILIDGREFVPDRRTGISRFLEGLIHALTESELDIEIVLASHHKGAVPYRLRDKERVTIREIPANFLISEMRLTGFARRDSDLFLSPYPKLPLFGTRCPALNTVHDIFYLTHATDKKKFKLFFDKYRLRRSLTAATLTWYASSWSMSEAQRFMGFTGSDPRVRYPGLDSNFNPVSERNKVKALDKYDLPPGYIIVIGNGLPHKNLGVLLKIAGGLSRRILFVGVPEGNQHYWRSKYPNAEAAWIDNVGDEDLPSVISGAFCLAQPSTMEGFGYPPLEAMACGVPAVVSDIPVLLETTGGNALIADPGEPETWSEAFGALEDENTHEAYVNRGLKWVEPFQGSRGWEKHVSDIRELLKTV
jgi:glycosyltransferase involved in cell wall biosynthesis